MCIKLGVRVTKLGLSLCVKLTKAKTIIVLGYQLQGLSDLVDMTAVQSVARSIVQ